MLRGASLCGVHGLSVGRSDGLSSSRFCHVPAGGLNGNWKRPESGMETLAGATGLHSRVACVREMSNSRLCMGRIHDFYVFRRARGCVCIYVCFRVSCRSTVTFLSSFSWYLTREFTFILSWTYSSRYLRLVAVIRVKDRTCVVKGVRLLCTVIRRLQ
jgi:hypothetical protein